MQWRPPPDERPAFRPPRPPPRTPIAADDLPGARRYGILHVSGLVGTTNLEYPLVRGTWAAGVLLPGEGYQLVRPVFRQYALAGPSARTTLKRFARDRDALGLTVVDGGTTPLEARVALISEWAGGPLMVHLSITDTRYWARFG